MTVSVPIVRFGGSVPGNLREWDRVLRSLNDFVKQAGGNFEISDNAKLPTNDSLVDGVRAFLPPPATPSPPIGSQIDALRPFMPRQTPETAIESKIDAIKTFLPPPMTLPPANDSQALLANKIFGAHR